MRKFLTGALLLLALALVVWYGAFERGWYISEMPRESVRADFTAEGRQIMHRTEEDGWTPLRLRGVELTASLPGHFTSDYAPTMQDYLRWMDQIAEMGANGLFLTNVLDDDFYNALWTHNQEAEEPLYLVQGVGTSDEAAARSGNADENGLMDQLTDNARLAVDVIHGRRDVPTGGLSGDGRYRRDVSPWVVGFLLGGNWQKDTLAYTDHETDAQDGYAGSYFASAEGARPVEAMLAEAMDMVATYETEKYGTQRLIGLTCDAETDFLAYESVYARQLGKYAFLDPNAIVATDEMKAGRFTGYLLSDFCDELDRCLLEEQKAALAPLLAAMDRTEPYGGRLSLLASYYEMPAVAVYGISSARGAITMGEEPLTEQAQGERLAEISRTLEEDGWAGCMVSAWQDGWSRRSWNTAFALENSRSPLWYDVQTAAKNTGLLAFEPGETPVCVMDGDRSEWAEGDLVARNGELSLYARQDAEGLYLMIDGLLEWDDAVYVPLDISPNLGSYMSDNPSLVFDNDADFLLALRGPEDSRLLVQERCDPVRANFLYEIMREDPYVNIPSEYSGRFVPVMMPLRNDALSDAPSSDKPGWNDLGLYETGKLVYGCANPEDEAFNSLADFCYGVGFVEVRIPWLLLNVGDPSQGAVHRDYYKSFGVDLTEVRSIHLGVAGEAAAGITEMGEFRLDRWNGSIPVRERLKQSYYVMRALWTR